MYQFGAKVRYSETGENSQLTYHGLFNYLQDSSTFHSEQLGGSKEALLAMDKAWVLSFWQVCIERMPALSEEIEVETWPYSTKGLFGQRNFCVEDREGNRIVKANSIWVLIEASTGRPVRIPEEIATLYPDEPRLSMEYCDRKIAVPSEYEQMEPIPVMKYLLDTNHHVNNGKYVMLAEQYLPADFQVREIRVEYKKAAVLGDVFYPRVTLCEPNGSMTVVLTDEVGNIYATILFLATK